MRPPVLGELRTNLSGTRHDDAHSDYPGDHRQRTGSTEQPAQLAGEAEDAASDDVVDHQTGEGPSTRSP